jgi:hypothetical protein
MRPKMAIGLACFAGTALALAAFRVSPREPVYAGRPLRAWLDQGAEPAAMAVHELGPAAAPWILKKLRWEHPRWGLWQRYGRGWVNLPRVAQRFLPRPRVAAFDETRASMLLLEIGPQALPQLVAALRDGNPGVRLAGALTLETLREQGFKDKRALEALRGAAQGGDSEVRAEIAAITARAELPPGR